MSAEVMSELDLSALAALEEALEAEANPDAIRAVVDELIPDGDQPAAHIDGEVVTAAQRRLAEETEFNRGNMANHVWESIPIQDAPEVVVLWQDNILPSLEAQDKKNIRAARNRVEDILNKNGVDHEACDNAKIAASEALGNIKRQYPMTGGEFTVGFDSAGRVILITDGYPSPRNVSYTPSEVHFEDPAEHGRGLKLVHEFGDVTRLPLSYDTEGNPNAWRLTCAIDTRRSLLTRLSAAMQVAVSTGNLET